MMRNALFVFSFLLMSPWARAEFCNWGFVGPKVYKCNGETYYYGTAACDSGFFSGIFCNQKMSQSGKACSDDNAPETVECYKQLIGPLKTTPDAKKDPPAKQEEFCNWGFAGPKVWKCNGKNYLFGTAACKSGTYSHVFCDEELGQNGKACAEDESPATNTCYERFVKAGGLNGVQSSASSSQGSGSGGRGDSKGTK